MLWYNLSKEEWIVYITKYPTKGFIYLGTHAKVYKAVEHITDDDE